MKKIIALGAILISVSGFSQCDIQGPKIINLMEETTYSIASGVAQCENCHLWSYDGGDIELIGDRKASSIKVKSRSVGPQSVFVTILAPNGIRLCRKNINVIDVPFSLNDEEKTKEEPKSKALANNTSVKKESPTNNTATTIPKETKSQQKAIVKSEPAKKIEDKKVSTETLAQNKNVKKDIPKTKDVTKEPNKVQNKESISAKENNAAIASNNVSKTSPKNQNTKLDTNLLNNNQSYASNSSNNSVQKVETKIEDKNLVEPNKTVEKEQQSIAKNSNKIKLDTNLMNDNVPLTGIENHTKSIATNSNSEKYNGTQINKAINSKESEVFNTDNQYKEYNASDSDTKDYIASDFGKEEKNTYESNPYQDEYESPEKLTCDVDVNNFTEIKSGENSVMLFPNNVKGNLKYKWVAYYQNGLKDDSTDTTPEFKYTLQNPISKIVLQLETNQCIKELSKDYKANFWQFFNYNYIKSEQY